MGTDGRPGSGFDGLARELASGELSRRAALKRFGGLALGAAIAAVPGTALGAERADRPCPKSRRCHGKCCPRHAKCKHGKCRCVKGFKKCGKKCFNLDTNHNHCGSCGNACAQNETCVGGVCQGGGECIPGSTRPCYSGPAGTENVGICHGGTQPCNTEGQWGSCLGEITPGTEICGNAVDDDCNGAIDNGCTVCGNDVAEPGEVCDGNDLGGETCVSQGFAGGGTLVCGGDCMSFDTSGCSSGCASASDCPGSDTACQTRTCVSGTCGFSNAGAGTVCGAPASCTGGQQTAASTCNGMGGCSPGQVSSCAPYTCGPSSCLTNCTTNAQCVAGYACAGGQCKKAAGQSCSTNSDCASNICTTGICQ